MKNKTSFEEIEGMSPEFNQRLRHLYTLVEQGKFNEFDDLFYEYDRKYEMAMAVFVGEKKKEWLDIIKKQQGEQEKEEYINSLPRTVYEEIDFSLTGILRYRDAGRGAREFKKSMGKSVQEVVDDLRNSWEKYNPYIEKNNNEFKDVLHAGISLEEQAQISQHFQESNNQDVNTVDSTEKSHDE